MASSGITWSISGMAAGKRDISCDQEMLRITGTAARHLHHTEPSFAIMLLPKLLHHTGSHRFHRPIYKLQSSTDDVSLHITKD